jgi:L-asparaginase
MALEKSILILTTGGTIDKQYFDSLSQYQITDTTVTKLLAIARVTHPFEIKEVLRKDSIELTDDDRARVLEHVHQATHSRIIITHGTDTMTLTSRALAMIPDKTVVLTGALAPSRFSKSDAAFNLGMAFAIAQIHSAGIYITMNGSVFRGDEAVKDRERGSFVIKTRTLLQFDFQTNRLDHETLPKYRRIGCRAAIRLHASDDIFKEKRGQF